MELSQMDRASLKWIIKEACKRFGVKEKAPSCKFYNRKGLEMMKDDAQFFKQGDVFYAALDGEPYNYCATLDDYEMGHCIGEGGFGKVYLATHKENHKKFAVKYMDISSTLNNASEINSLYSEANSLKNLRHKNIIDLYQAFIEGKQLIMIMELASGGELLDYVQKKGKVDETEARQIIIQICQAIAYCHSNGVVHRDLKLENVLFLDDPEELSVKVIDFGISGVCTAFQADKVDAGTIVYMPPEAFSGVPLTTSPSIDVWAIGLMMYAMLFGTLPFYSDNEKQLKEKIKTAKITFPSDVALTDMGRDLLLSMLDRDPKKRLELLNFMNTEYFNIDDEAFAEMYAKIRAEKDAENERKAAAAKAKEEEELSYHFDSSLHLPPSSSKGRSGGASPGRAKKKKTTKSSSAAAAASGEAASGTKASHKNKKTIK